MINNNSQSHSTFLKMGLAAATIVAVAGTALGANTQDAILLMVSHPVGLAIAGLTLMIDFMNQYDQISEERIIRRKEIQEKYNPVMPDLSKINSSIADIRHNYLSDSTEKTIKPN
jgi:hypothetical protein